MNPINRDLFIKALQNPDLYDYPIDQFEVIETHLSWILLTGSYAYKIKKPVKFSFVDFSTLKKRKVFCEEELALNKPLAFDIYQKVIPIYGSLKNPHFTKKGAIVEYALKMRQFNRNYLLKNKLKKSKTKTQSILKLATKIAEFHLATNKVSLDSPFGSLALILQTTRDNFTVCQEILQDKNALKKLNQIEIAMQKALAEGKETFIFRKKSGFIRNCHGDLHLENILLEKQNIILFDRIEFNPAFRCIDVIEDLAFLLMDLLANHYPLLANHLLNQYLQKTGDYEGLLCIKFYIALKAMVRAKVFLLSQKDIKDSKLKVKNTATLNTYLDLALNILAPKKPLLIIMQGVPGSGKTHISSELAPFLNAICIRSDVERVRPKEAAVSAKNRKLTYLQLNDLAETILQAGFSVIVDATFISAANRQLFKKLSQKLRVPFVILHCNAPLSTLKDRVTLRQQNIQKTKKRTGENIKEIEGASKADLKVLLQLLKRNEPLTSSELRFTLTIDTRHPIDYEALSRNDIFGQ